MSVLILDPSLCGQNASTASYHFCGAAGEELAWPTAPGAHLGAGGAWNFFRRIGVRPSFLSRPCEPNEQDILVVCAEGPLPGEGQTIVANWEQCGGAVLAAGCPSAFPQHFAPSSSRVRTASSPFSGLAWLFPGQQPQMAAPGGWSWIEIGPDTFACHGELALLRGERQSPERALVERLPDAPAFASKGAFLYANANPFAALQAWLQGQADLSPWLQWRHRLFWLDEYCAELWRHIAALCGPASRLQRMAAAGCAPLTVVLRHDLDGSTDTSYLDALESRGLPGVHAVLPNENTRPWVARLARAKDQESALHYPSVRPWGLWDILKAKCGHARVDAFLPDMCALAPARLLGLREAREKGIGVRTLHRHGPFVVYPEYVETLNAVELHEPGVLGASSYFRGIVLRYGKTYPIDGFASMASSPDSQFPFWLPYRLVNAARGGRLVAPYESTCLLEPEPGLVEQMLRHSTPLLPQRVLMFNFHPAHAHAPTFCEGGSLRWYEEILDLIGQAGAEVLTYAELLKRIRAHDH